MRAATETDEQVGDRANDAVRITGEEVRARVIAEGANLACTQRGRIEAARRGVRLDTDAIDNSAGVDTSDVEVNIKIALSLPERDGRLAYEARNRLLADMTGAIETWCCATVSPDAGALAGGTAWPGRFRLRAAAHAGAGTVGPPQPCSRVLAR